MSVVIATSRPPLVLDVCTTRTACGQPARSGIVLSINGTNGCSLGFRAAATDGSKWVITAGHCAVVNDTIGHGAQPFGPVRLQTLTVGGLDFLRARIDNSYWLSSGGGYLYNAASPNSPLSIYYSLTTTSSIVVGQYVCLNAWNSSAASCGSVNSVNTATGRVSVGFDACPGDSGGAWTWRSSAGLYFAFGVHSQSDQGCHLGGGTSYFSSIPEINEYNDAHSAATVRVEER